MNVDRKICPYPGLRPFNEEESIFFKGRDEHIQQVILQLEAKKFLMLTGASGDGKSSLVYAGVIPNARAGFFKAKHNSWVVADFRPERSPLKNLATSLCRALEIKDTQNAEKELGYGFSALVDLYRSSGFYLDQQTDGYIALDETEKRKAKRKAANLLILVDQFEEFFTNIENYPGNRPSFAAQAVVNLLLETSRIALEKDLPIYIVCTMRSDYIGQCASFRGLPEFIGFSQFFVPRLNRREIYQVIEEPAILNGDKIAKRLVETLISKLDEGIDQLPVLQHALNQVWQCAGNGEEQMDLLHFAKVGGLHKKYLNTADRVSFENWLSGLPNYKWPFYNNPSLDNVLDTHANELYEVAASQVKSRYNKPITEHDAKLLIEATFKCLTKIDEGRAVRNRMTLQEIAQVINGDNLSTASIGETLNIFREQGNTFLKPFITDEAGTEVLQPGSVLDITHESLIRNWTLLSTWAKEENEAHQNFQDFNKQLQRWISSNRSAGYLLPIGPLTFFEDWFKKTKPNKYWLVKYDERDIPNERKLTEADATLNDANEFIRTSARKLIFNRTIIRFGANKIMATLGLLLLLISCTYFTFDFSKKQNGHVLNEVEQKGRELLLSDDVENDVKGDFILLGERLHPGSFRQLLGTIKTDSQRLDVLRLMMTAALRTTEASGKTGYNPLLDSLFIYELDYLNQKHVITDANFANSIGLIIAVVYENILVKQDAGGLYCANEIKNKYTVFCDSTYAQCLRFLNNRERLKNIEIIQLNKLLQNMPLLVGYNKEKISTIASTISPFSHAGSQIYAALYPKDKSVVYTMNPTKEISHNGGYFQLANLYALCGDFDHLNACFDSLLVYNKDYMTVNTGYNYQCLLYDLIISGSFYSNAGVSFIKKLEAHKPAKDQLPMLMQLVYDLTRNYKRQIEPTSLLMVYGQNGPELSMLADKEKISFDDINGLINFMKTMTMESNSLGKDEQNYLLALLYKESGFLSSGLNFDMAFSYFNKVGLAYAEQKVPVGSGADAKLFSRSYIFKFPAPYSLIGFNTWENDATEVFSDRRTGAFIKYITDSNKVFKEYNTNQAELSEFLLYYGQGMLRQVDQGYPPEQINITPFIDALSLDDSGAMDKDAARAFLAIYYFKTGDPLKAKEYAAKIDLKKLFQTGRWQDAKNVKTIYADLGTRLCVCNAMERTKTRSEATKSVFDVINVLPAEYEYMKRNALIVIIDSLQNRGMTPLAIKFTDTLINSYITRGKKFGNKTFYILGKYNSTGCNKITTSLIRTKNDIMKMRAFDIFVQGIAASGNYYDAYHFIPSFASTSNQLMMMNSILKAEAKKTNHYSAADWTYFDNDVSQLTWTEAYEVNDKEISWLQVF